MSAPEEPWDLVVGQVTAPFGVRGEVKVRPETDFPERFLGLRQVCLEFRNGEEKLVRVRGARLTPKAILVTFAGYADRDQVEALRGAWVKIRESTAAPLPEGSYYVHRLLGLQVVTEDGRELGEITEVLRTPANDVYVTPQALIPALREVVKEINFAQRRMVVAPPLEDTAAESETGERSPRR